jgi:uncharacterized protein YegP (UPF0339 family)
MKLELYKDVDKEWRWRIIARNGRTVADSTEGYKKRATLKKTLRRMGIEKITTNAGDLIAE